MDDTRHDESAAERADRNFGDLLQELRVTETGVQILFSLLLTVPFSARFPDITDFQQQVYFCALLLAASANVVLIAPVAYHRLLFASGRKPTVVRWSNRLALVGLGLLVLSVSAVLLLISDVLLPTVTAWAVSVGFGVATATLWLGPPLLAGRSDGRGGGDDGGPGAGAPRAPGSG